MPAIVFRNATKPSRFPHFDKVHNPLRLPRKTTSERRKVFRTCQYFFLLLTWKCASHHNGVHFFDISTSKSGPRLVCKCASRHNSMHFSDVAASKSAPKMRCFVHFDLEMCFAPQRRALFRHHNWSDVGVLCKF